MATKPIEKQPSETIRINFDFSSKMTASETIVSVDSNVSDPAGIVFGNSPVINAQDVYILISGGVAPGRYDIDQSPYKLTMIVTTSIGQVLEEDITLNVQDK